MTTPFFLIDFENVQPKALGRLQPGAARIKVFLGQHQSKLMLELVQALQPFGKGAKARATLVISWLQKASKPATLATLRSTIRARLNPLLDDKQIAAVIQSLKDSKKITVVGTKVTYAL